MVRRVLPVPRVLRVTTGFLGLRDLQERMVWRGRKGYKAPPAWTQQYPVPQDRREHRASKALRVRIRLFRDRRDQPVRMACRASKDRPARILSCRVRKVPKGFRAYRDLRGTTAHRAFKAYKVRKVPRETFPARGL